MTAKEINRANITAFVTRAINHAAATAIDAEFGLRMTGATVTVPGNVVIEFEGGVALVLTGTPVCRGIANVN